MPRVSTGLASLLSLLALSVGARPALATATLVTLHDVVFSDGGTASGTFSLNILGFLDPQRDVVTTAGSVLGGTTYTASGSENNSKPPADFVVFFSPGFKDGVQFQFQQPLGTIAIDPIILGGVSCEFDSFGCQSGPHRDVISGFAESEVVINLPQVPEPSSLLVFLTGPLGLAMVRRRRPSPGVRALDFGHPTPRRPGDASAREPHAPVPSHPDWPAP